MERRVPGGQPEAISPDHDGLTEHDHLPAAQRGVRGDHPHALPAAPDALPQPLGPDRRALQRGDSTATRLCRFLPRRLLAPDSSCVGVASSRRLRFIASDTRASRRPVLPSKALLGTPIPYPACRPHSRRECRLSERRRLIVARRPDTTPTQLPCGARQFAEEHATRCDYAALRSGRCSGYSLRTGQWHSNTCSTDTRS